MKRRNFLKISGAAGGGLLLSMYLPTPSFSKKEGENAFKPNAFVRLDSDGSVTFTLTKHEMGQGSGTGLPMILADEMDADWSKLKVENSPYDPQFDRRTMGTTGGSGTIAKMWEPMRQAGAAARAVLVAAAAEKWGVPAGECTTEAGVVSHATGKTANYGDLAEAASKLKVPEEVKLKEAKDFKIIGTETKNLITKDVLQGKGRYGINTQVPGMVYAAIARCPVYQGKVVSFDDSEARKMKGVSDVFKISVPDDGGQHVQDGVVIVADNTWTAFEARKKLKIEWDEGEHADSSTEKVREAFRKKVETPGEPVYQRGDFEAVAATEGNKVMEATYENPYEAHALMEPINATASFKDGKCEIWVAAQTPERVAQHAARVLAIPIENVTTNSLNSGGSFGRRFYVDSTIEAAFISKKIGKPVKVTWSREDEISHDYFHPFQHSNLKAVIGPDKTVLGWNFRGVRAERYISGSQPWDIPYHFDNIYTEFHPMPSIVHVGAWRSVHQHSSAFGKECFIDELAAEVGKDPLDFRLELLEPELKKEGDDDRSNYAFELLTLLRKRHKSVLGEMKKSGIWKRKDLPAGRFQGLAVQSFDRTVCGHIVEISIGERINVHRVDSFVDCGTVINPHFGRGQVEGSIIWALSSCLYGGVEVEKGRVQRTNFHDNRLLRIDETPEINVNFLPSEEEPSGLGEPATPPFPPALVNAIFAATGKRIRKLPIDVKELQKKEKPVTA